MKSRSTKQIGALLGIILATACSGTTNSEKAAPSTTAGAATTTTVAVKKVVHPCTLVTKSEAAAIIGRAIKDPLEAPQGPTCIYQTPDSKISVTLTVEQLQFSRIKPLVAHITSVSGLRYEAYCGDYGRPMLFVVLTVGQVLAIDAPCATAQRFAAQALPRL